MPRHPTPLHSQPGLPRPPALPSLQTLVPTVVPGIVFGILGLLGFIFFSCWMCTHCCCRRPRLVPMVSAADQAQQQQQFISGGGEPSAPEGGDPPRPSWRQRRWAQPGFLFKALLVALALTVFAISTWGLVESIQATNNTFSDMWDIVDAVDAKASSLSGCLARKSIQMAGLWLCMACQKVDGLLALAAMVGTAGWLACWLAGWRAARLLIAIPCASPAPRVVPAGPQCNH